ncbi:pentatricopeptide repeat-containing protein At1g19720-like [Actinidia eriantha]|uniref:pentatricopeptide repeat-containing protein At1g19720-like n=1 Tax=Actinidia eriantha TaxID=165200 RepID=UPI0025874883|nr:pentatricopeptide repeat-containing protein At1g19720-like [Actinidia eriantha]
MATLQSRLLPCNHLLPDNSCLTISSNHRFTIFSPKSNFYGTTAKNSGLKQSVVSTQRNPLGATVEIAKDYSWNSASEQKNEVSDSLSLLNLFSVKGNNFFYDCKQVHGLYVKLGAIGSKSLIGNKLVILYLENEVSLGDARKLFDEIPRRTLPAYAALMGSYCRSERWDELFLVFRLMIDDEMMPDKYLVPTILKACSAVRSLRSGKMVHGYVVRREFGTDVFVGNAIIDLYANCGDLTSSRNVFGAMKERDVVSWTILFSVYMDGGLLKEANDVFQSMQVNGVKPDLICWNAFVSGFARNGDIGLAFQSLEEMQEKGLKPKVNSWNSLISGCVQSGYFEDALYVFNRMLWFPENPNAVTIVSILPACGGMEDLKLGRAIHGYATKSKLPGNIHVEGSLIDMYSKCGRSDYAEKIFLSVENENTALCNEMIAAYVYEGKMDAALKLLRSMKNGDLKPDEITYHTILAGYARQGKKNDAYELLSEMTKIGLKPNIVSFNNLISGFQQYGLTYEALKLFRFTQLPSNSCFGVVRPNPVTVTGALAACADLRLLRQGKEIHGYLIKNNFESNIFVSSALVDTYGKCRDLSSAAKVFWNIEDRNTVSWNSLIAGHVNNKHTEDALELFNVMLAEGHIPSLITFMILLPACSDMEAPSVGRALHGYILKSPNIKLNSTLASALIEMYAKCGYIVDAKLVF